MAKKLKWICTAAAVMAAALSVRGETWADWLVPPKNAPLVAEFQPGWVVDPVQRNAYIRPEEYLELNRGYEGRLVFSPADGAEPVPGPLTVHLLYSVATPEEMNWPEGELPTNFIPAVLPSVAPRRAVSEETWSLPAEFPLRVPVVLPRACNLLQSWTSSKVPGLFGRYEVRDASGRVLCRGTLPARRVTENARSLVGMDEGDEAMKRLTESSGTIDRVGNLPDEMSAYRQVRGIWFTESLWKKMEGREALARRLLLSGVRISGETALVERIRAALGTGRDGQVLGSSAAPSAWSSGNDFSLRDLNLIDETTAGHGTPRTIREKSVFDNEVNLFAADRQAYLIWTLAGLLVFSVGVAAILAIVFFRLKGERRVAVWWALPAWSVLCFAAIWAGGTLSLERRPRAEVTEYRLLMAGWPEMYCRAVASAMTFEPGRPEWKLPPGAVIDDPRSGQLDGWWARQDAELSAEGIRLWLPRQLTGKTMELEAGWFEPATLPVMPEDGTAAAPGRWLVAVEDVDGVFVLVDGEWRELGPMKVGVRLDPRAGKQLEGNRLPGLPAALHNEFVPWQRNGECQDPQHHHPPALESPPPKHDWVVVSWKRGVPPRVAPVWQDSLTKGRVIWVMQCP